MRPGIAASILAGVALLLGALVAASSAAAGAPPAESSTSCVQSSLQAVVADCEWTYSDYSASSASDDGHTWVVTLQCGNGGICTDLVECVEGGQPGLWHDVYMDGADVGDVCVPEAAVDEVSIAQLAIREFKRLQWPASELKVQPPGGETLVNLETIFYTDNSSATLQQVRLAGRSVTIEATPASYGWDFGDGTTTTATSPGRAYPDHDVFHVYASTGTVAASVATTYAGRFRIGNGTWQPIPETLTVAGESVGLDILEAKPQLVIR